MNIIQEDGDKCSSFILDTPFAAIYQHHLSARIGWTHSEMIEQPIAHNAIDVSSDIQTCVSQCTDKPSYGKGAFLMRRDIPVLAISPICRRDLWRYVYRMHGTCTHIISWACHNKIFIWNILHLISRLLYILHHADSTSDLGTRQRPARLEWRIWACA